MTMMRLAKPEHEVHVVLDEQHRDVLRQVVDRGEQLGALVARHAGGRLVEQQHLGLGRERERDFEQPLLAVGELAGLRGSRRRPSMQRVEDVVGLVDGVAIVG